jgi:hypothetical protein
LRYYADLARFANAYKQLEEPLDLELPKVVLPTTSGAANATAVRNLLGLQADEALPAWAGEAPARRTAASRLPSNHEVIRMLLAFAERTLSTPAIRADLVWEAPENEARRVHAREIKKENEEWARIKKNLMAAALHCKTPAATKLNREKVSFGPCLTVLTFQITKATKEHEMRLAPASVSHPLTNATSTDRIGQSTCRPFFPGIPTRTTRHRSRWSHILLPHSTTYR